VICQKGIAQLHVSNVERGGRPESGSLYAPDGQKYGNLQHCATHENQSVFLLDEREYSYDDLLEKKCRIQEM
jgi:hypothetical protein